MCQEYHLLFVRVALLFLTMHCEENVSCWCLLSCETFLSSVLLKARPTDLMSLQPGVHPGWSVVWLEGSHVSRTVSNRKWKNVLESGVWRVGSSQNSVCGTIPQCIWLSYTVKPWGVGGRRGCPTKNSYFSAGPDFMHLSMMSLFFELEYYG